MGTHGCSLGTKGCSLGTIGLQLVGTVRQEGPRLSDTFHPSTQAIVSAEDQDCNVHMLCEYLSPVLPPSELNDPGKIARMVRMMQWEDDDEVFGGTRSNVWQARVHLPHNVHRVRKAPHMHNTCTACAWRVHGMCTARVRHPGAQLFHGAQARRFRGPCHLPGQPTARHEYRRVRVLRPAAHRQEGREAARVGHGARGRRLRPLLGDVDGRRPRDEGAVARRGEVHGQEEGGGGEGREGGGKGEGGCQPWRRRRRRRRGRRQEGRQGQEGW